MKVYMLLNIPDEKSTQVAKVLQGQTGVVIADVVEGPPDIVVMVEVSDRQKLADRAIKAISSVEDMIDNIKLLPTTIGSTR